MSIGPDEIATGASRSNRPGDRESLIVGRIGYRAFLFFDWACPPCSGKLTKRQNGYNEQIAYYEMPGVFSMKVPIAKILPSLPIMTPIQSSPMISTRLRLDRSLSGSTASGMEFDEPATSDNLGGLDFDHDRRERVYPEQTGLPVRRQGHVALQGDGHPDRGFRRG